MNLKVLVSAEYVNLFFSISIQKSITVWSKKYSVRFDIIQSIYYRVSGVRVDSASW